MIFEEYLHESILSYSRSNPVQQFGETMLMMTLMGVTCIKFLN